VRKLKKDYFCQLESLGKGNQNGKHVTIAISGFLSEEVSL